MKSLLVLTVFILFTACNFEASNQKTPKNTLFIGIDVSGSFTRTKKFNNGMTFLANYIHSHINGLGGLAKPTDLYVGGVGGDTLEEPQSFFPIHDFIGRTPKQIEAKLRKEFGGQKDNLTDFNTFFFRVKTLVKQKNLVLAPISVVLITDGVPEIANRKSKKAVKQAYSKIDISPLEYLAKNISIRILYAAPKVGYNWRHYVPTKRIKVWTVEPQVMYGWSDQLKINGQKGMYAWIRDNVDLRIKSRGI
ncbi:MAG: hypothetical protein HOE90_03280 [Bacteriovoracaceae bacterium]|jgi:hypothetical protein|nr:hypothetical protein [Bacteriovoracaceae bacterium]